MYVTVRILWLGTLMQFIVVVNISPRFSSSSLYQHRPRYHCHYYQSESSESRTMMTLTTTMMMPMMTLARAFLEGWEGVGVNIWAAAGRFFPFVIIVLLAIKVSNKLINIIIFKIITVTILIIITTISGWLVWAWTNPMHPRYFLSAPTIIRSLCLATSDNHHHDHNHNHHHHH